jgi:tetratricopeptide (TPR) repeat protein
MLQTLGENPSELTVSLIGGTSAGDQHIEAVVARESVKPLAVLGSVKRSVGDNESAMVLFESALEYLDVAEAAAYWRGGQMQRETIEGHLRDIKREMGLISPSEEVAELRKSLNRLIKEKKDELQIATAKIQLALALKDRVDPPKYFEAVKLLKECCVMTTQVYGPDHEIATIAKQFYDETRKDYMLYLQDIAKKGKEQM